MTRHTGGCHCGSLRIEFETDAPLVPRACQCSFCVRHHARSVSDPGGLAVISPGPETLRYRFASGSADFLICGRCGVYVGVAQEIEGQLYAVLNLTAFDDPHDALAGEPMNYDGETPAARTARRLARWTPARIVSGGAVSSGQG